MRRRRVAPLLLALILAVGAGAAYRRSQQIRQHPRTPVPIALEATAALTSPSATGWKPVPVPLTPGAPRVTPLVDDPAARTRACGTWDAQATAQDGWTQRDCVARLASGGQENPALGASVFITKMRWAMVASAYGISRTPGPDPEAWVIVVRFDAPDDTSATIILDDSTGAPYLRIDRT